MKTLFIPAKVKAEINEKRILEISEKLPKQIAIVYSIQYQDIAKEIKEILSKKHKITSFIQVLGCSKPKFSKTTQAVLLIGSGRFHAVSLAIESGFPIYILDSNNLTKIPEQEIGQFQKKQKASYLKFLHTDKIGILISTKPGQQKLERAIKFKQKQKKKSYLFLADNINTAEFENFQIDFWVNTACPRIDMDSSEIINIDNLE